MKTLAGVDISCQPFTQEAPTATCSAGPARLTVPAMTVAATNVAMDARMLEMVTAARR